MKRTMFTGLSCLILSATALAAAQQQTGQAQQAQTLQQGAQQLLTPGQVGGGSGVPDAPAIIAPPRPIEPGERIVELALCLDTSGSMEGLINAARVKLWEIVNDLALATPTPRLRVALLTYGNDGHNAENGWVNIDIGFTEDLDMVSQRLFALTTNGGTELVGRVLKAAGERLDWNASDDVLKLIVVAGNESADQDTTFNFRDVCKATISKGVMINSIYCGNLADDIAPAWKEVSTLADGHFASIDQNNGTITIATPFDDDLVTLSASMNTTYIAYGAQGEWSAANQTLQDTNAAGAGAAVAAQRAVTKSGKMYCNAQWDLVDACNAANVNIEDIKTEDLPENMRGMSMDERKAYVAEMAAKRSEIQKQVADLNLKRGQYVEEEMKKMAESGDKSFDAAIRTAIRAQAASKGFQFEQKQAPEGGASARPAFIQRGEWFIDAAFIDEYDALMARNAKPTYDETFVNSPEGRAALLDRLGAAQRREAQAILDKVMQLQHWGGGMIVRVNGGLLHLPFDC